MKTFLLFIFLPLILVGGAVGGFFVWRRHRRGGFTTLGPSALSPLAVPAAAPPPPPAPKPAPAPGADIGLQVAAAALKAGPALLSAALDAFGGGGDDS